MRAPRARSGPATRHTANAACRVPGSNPRLRFFRPPPSIRKGDGASQLPAQIIVSFASSIGRSQRKKPDVALTPGLVAHQRVRPSVIGAALLGVAARWGARTLIDHSPDWQMRSSMAGSPAISAILARAKNRRLVLNASWGSPLTQLYSANDEVFRGLSIRVSNRQMVHADIQKILENRDREIHHTGRNLPTVGVSVLGRFELARIHSEGATETCS